MAEQPHGLLNKWIKVEDEFGVNIVGFRPSGI